MRLSRAWAVAIALLFIQSTSSGLGFYNMSVYVAEFSGYLGLSVASISLAVSCFFIAGGISGLLVSRWIDRVDIRLLMCAGAVIGGIALALMAQATALWQIYLLFILFGVGNTAVSLVVGTTLIARWFPGANRSIAMSIAFTGLSLGGVLLTPLSAYLLTEWGVPETMPWLGLMFVALTVPLILTIIALPPPVAPEDAAPDVERGYRRAISMPLFRWISVGYVFCMASQVGGIAHLYGRVEAMADFATASMAVQALSIGSMLGRFVGGVAATRMPVRVFTLWVLGVQTLGILSVGIAPTPVFAVAAAGLMGLGVGNLLMSQPLWMAHEFPADIYPRVFALSNALTVLGVASGPLIMGIIVDWSSHSGAFIFAVVLSVVAAICFLTAARYPRYDEAEPNSPGED